MKRVPRSDVFRDLSLVAVVIFLAIVTYAIYLQSTQLTTISRTLQRVQDEAQTAPAPTPTSTSVAPSDIVKGDERWAFGSLKSPDQAWELVYRFEPGTPSRSAAHRLIMRSLTQVPDQNLIEENAEMDPVNRLRPRWEWQAAGWSADGQFVYYTTKRTTGAAVPLSHETGFGVQIFEVNVNTRFTRRITALPEVSDPWKEGYRDVLPSLDLSVWSTRQISGTHIAETLQLSNVANTRAQQMMEVRNSVDEDVGITAAVINKDGTEVAFLTYRVADAAKPTYWYNLYVYDIAQGTRRQVKDVFSDQTPYSEWASLHWLDLYHVSIDFQDATNLTPARSVSIVN